MEPLTAGAIAIGAMIATKAVEKTGEKVGETFWNKTGELIVTLNKHSPHTVVAIEKASSQPLNYGKAVSEVESAAKANPEVNQAVQELVAAAKEQQNLQLFQTIQKIVDTLKSQPQQPNVINYQKLASEIKNVFQGNTYNAPVTFN